MGDKIFSRRNFVKRFTGIFTSGAIASIVVTTGCNSNDSDKESIKTKKEVVDCDDFSGVSESELKKRQALGYVVESTVPGSHCANCALYVPPKEGEKCGGCLLFDGPVRVGGYCSQYQPKV